MTKPVAIIMGSQSDLKVLEDAAKTLKTFGIKYHIEVVSAHRTPEKMYEFSKSAQARGFQVIIAGAGGAAHLPGMVASLTNLPVIGVPIKSSKLKGLDSLLSIAQMPSGVPVATMAIDNATNASLLALRILALNNKTLQKKLESHRSAQKKKVLAMNQVLKKRIRKLG